MNVHQEVERLLADMLDRVSGRVPGPVMEDIERVTDEISTLVMAHVVPEPLGELDGYGLSKREARTASLLLAKLGKVVTRDALMNAVYFDQPDDMPGQKIIDIFIMRVRRKMERSPYAVETEIGFGYRMVRKH